MTTYIHDVFSRLLADVSELSKVPLGIPDDISYDWVLNEGPKLDKALLLYLEGSGEIPVPPEWLMPLWDKFLLTQDGIYLGYIRQCLLFCYKIEHEPTNEQLKAAQAAFEDTEASIAVFDCAFSTIKDCDPMFSSARKIVARSIYGVDWSSISPKHGPGAVYPSAKPCDKGKFTTIYTTIEKHYPYLEYFCGLPNYWNITEAHGVDANQNDTIECRLVAVPKDSRGPRLICVHPSEAVWIQQGCRQLLEQAISSPKSPCYQKITFDDQRTNGRIALASSSSREYVTLDLKEASDRISCHLVRYLFGTYVYDILSCSRATQVRLLDDRVIELRKWAPMGNALTFPVQSLLFLSLVRAGILCRYGIDCTDVYVFGDDIIFPSKFYDGALSALVRAGVIPNMSKTFRHGFFRESCGVDAYRGKDVTPHRLKRVDVSSCSGAMSACSLAKSLAIDGYHRTSQYLYRMVEGYHGKLPLSNNPDAQGLCRYENCTLVTLLKYEPSIRFNRDIHRWETRVYLVQAARESGLSGAWWRLQESLLAIARLGDSYISTRGQEYTVPHRERSKRGWIEVLCTSNSGVPSPNWLPFPFNPEMGLEELDRCVNVYIYAKHSPHTEAKP